MNLLAVVLVAFAFGFIGSMPLAGPIALLVFARGIEGDLRGAARIAIGASIAEGLYATVAFWGFSVLSAGHPLMVPISHGLTAIVLIAVGGYFLAWKPSTPADAATPSPAPRKSNGHTSALVVGFMISALNPTLIVTWSAAVAWLYSRQFVEFAPWMAAPFGGMAAVGVLSWFLVMLALLRRYRDRFPHKVLTWIVRSMGLALIAFGLFSAGQLASILFGSRAF